MTVAANPATVGPLMQPALQINQTQIDMCKFSSDAFKYEASRQNVRSYPTPLGNIADLLPTWNWLNATSPNKSGEVLPMQAGAESSYWVKMDAELFITTCPSH